MAESDLLSVCTICIMYMYVHIFNRYVYTYRMILYLVHIIYGIWVLELFGNSGIRIPVRAYLHASPDSFFCMYERELHVKLWSPSIALYYLRTIVKHVVTIF